MRVHSGYKSRDWAGFRLFRCTGADCEDTCCGDWNIPIDRQTYLKYRACDDPGMRPLLHRFIQINPKSANDEDFAGISLAGNRCPLLEDGLCSVQVKLGEAYLSHTCASYPRARVVIDGVEERALYLSCPEAARLVLLNPDPQGWQEGVVDPEVDSQLTEGRFTLQGAPVLDSSRANRGRTAYPYFNEVRQLFFRALTASGFARWQRLAIVAKLSEELNEILGAELPPGQQAEITAEFIRLWNGALQDGAFEVSREIEPQPQIQVEAVLELIVARIGSDFTARRFLECYQEFMKGLNWGPESTMEELDRRFREARDKNYQPFMSRHEYLLDNFLVNYATRNLFPFGHRETESLIQIDYAAGSVQRQYLLLAAHYATVRALLIGMAAYHGAAFGTEHVIKLVQSYAKAFLHSGSFPGKVFETLASHGIDCASKATVLFQE